MQPSQSSKLALVLLVVAVFSAPSVALADKALPSQMEPSEIPNLDPGLWLRAEVGFGTSTVHREHNSLPILQTSTAEVPVFGLGIGYVPAPWIAVGFVGNLARTTTTLESAGDKNRLATTTALAGVGAHLYPFDSLGLSFALAGGWGFAYLDNSVNSSLMMGPGISAAIGFDGRITQTRSWGGQKLGEAASSQLFGAALRFDVAPSVKGEDFEGHAYTLAFVLGATL